MTLNNGVWCKIGTYLGFCTFYSNIYLYASVNLAFNVVFGKRVR